MTDKKQPLTTANPAANGQHPTSEGPVFSVNSLYVKNVSLEAPRSPYVFQEEWQPKLDFDLQMSSKMVDEKQKDIYEVVVHLTVTVKMKDEKPAFLIEVQQAGVFTVDGFPPDVMKQILSTACPNVLYPYAREAVSNLVQRAGFPQLLLPPINFEAMYAQHLASQDGKGETKAGEKK